MLTRLWGNRPCPPTICLSGMPILSPLLGWQVLLHGFAGSQQRCQILLGPLSRAFLFVLSCSSPLCGQTPVWKLPDRNLSAGGFFKEWCKKWGIFICVCNFVIIYPLLPAIQSAFIMINAVLLKNEAATRTCGGAALQVGSQLSGSLPTNFREVRRFWFACFTATTQIFTFYTFSDASVNVFTVTDNVFFAKVKSRTIAKSFCLW